MSNEKDLLSAANKGDSNAMYDLAFHYQDQGNIKEAVYWWEESAKKGDEYGSKNAIIYQCDPTLGKSSQEFFDCIKRHAVDYNFGWAKIVLGALFCGEAHAFWKNYFNINDFTSYINFDQGFKLIEEGVSLMGKSEINLNRWDYMAIKTAYLNHKDEISEIRTVPYLKKALEYLHKEIELVPDDDFETKAILKGQVEVTNEQIKATLKAEASFNEFQKKYFRN